VLDYYKIIFLGLLFFLVSNKSFGQDNNDTIKNAHSPKKATILSAVLPGAGQFYNKKYWKMPIIYAGFGTLGYFLSANQTRYNNYKNALLYRTDDDPLTIDKYPEFSNEGLLQAKNYYRRNVELSYIFTVVLYVLNIVDATVDAHLYDFDISDDLSLRLQPTLIQIPTAYNMPAQGIKLTFNLKTK